MQNDPMTRASLFRFARVALATLMVAMAAFGHIYGKSHHDHSQPGQRLARTDAVKPNLEATAASAVTVVKVFARSTALPDIVSSDESGCGCCFSGCGCCSTALARQNEDFSPPVKIDAGSLAPAQAGIPLGLRPQSLFRPPRLPA